MPRKEKKFHFIYKTTNLLSGKYYIGMHSTNDLDDGYLGSGTRLRYSINKHGIKNHVREILEFVDSREELKKREKEIVTLNEIAKEECMNLTVGGEGGFRSEQQRLNAEKSNAKQKILRETDPEWVDNYRLKKSLGQKEAYNRGRKKVIPDWNGRSHSDEAKKKMSESSKGMGVGKENSQYGTCWITRDGENKKIKKEELGEFIQHGWEKGRKLKK
jgi:hypothetical protein